MGLIDTEDGIRFLDGVPLLENCLKDSTCFSQTIASESMQDQNRQSISQQVDNDLISKDKGFHERGLITNLESNIGIFDAMTILMFAATDPSIQAGVEQRFQIRKKIALASLNAKRSSKLKSCQSTICELSG